MHVFARQTRSTNRPQNWVIYSMSISGMLEDLLDLDAEDTESDPDEEYSKYIYFFQL